MIPTLNMAERETEQIQKASANQEEAAVIAEPDEMKITDLDADCLEHIFKYLSIRDLLNVANSRNSFKEGVEHAFTSKYGKREVLFFIEKSKGKIFEKGKGIIVKKFATGLIFLRCFGALISTLKVSGLRRKQHREFDRYLNDYCIETLKDLTFFDAPERAIAGLKQPFENVERLCVHCGVLGEKLSDFSKWFPGLQSLKLFRLHSLANSECIEVHLPNLKCLDIDDSHSVFHLDNVSNCFRLNPQLKTLHISKFGNIASVLRLASELLQLEELIVYRPIFVGMKEVVHFNNVKRFGFDFSIDRWPVSYRPLPRNWWLYRNRELVIVLPDVLPLSFGNVETFSLNLHTISSVIVSERLVEIIKRFINMHPSVKTKVITFRCIKMSHILKINLMAESFGNEWRASFKLGDNWHNIEFERNI